MQWKRQEGSASIIQSHFQCIFMESILKSKIPMLQYRGKNEKLPSTCNIDNAFAKEVQVYTGDKMIGIGQLHKSNVFS